MQRISMTYGPNLFGQSEVTLLHDALPEGITIVHEDPATIAREVESILVGETKAILAKFLNVVKKSKYEFLSCTDQANLQDLEKLKRGFTRRTRLQKMQERLFLNEDKIKALLPSPRSRYYPSQTCKYDFFQAVIRFELSHISALISSNV